MSFDSRYFAYELDPTDSVCAVCRDWDGLAAGFSFAGPRAAGLVGTLIYRHIAGNEIREVFRSLFARARAQRRRLTVPFRCDGPTVRRFMELELELQPAGALRVTSVPVREEPRPPVALLDYSRPRSGEFLIVCAWCKKIRVRQTWSEVEEAIAELELLGEAQLPQLSHGICPACARQMGFPGEPGA